MPSERRPSRLSAVLLALVAVALAIGAAASLIAGAATASPFHTGGPAAFYLSPNDLALLALTVAIVIGGVALWTLSSDRIPVPGRVAVTLLSIVLIGILAAVILHAFAGTVGPGPGSLPGSNGTSNGTGTIPNGTLPGNVSGAGAPLGPLNLHLPSWTLFAVIAAAALIAAAVAVPALWRRSDTGGDRRSIAPADLGEVRGALATAARELEEGTDPRSVVIRLYGTLLARVGPIVGGIDRDTPEEIRVIHLVQLGIRSEAATTLTRLFEEARYSTHAMGPDSSARATDAIRDAREDLDRPPPDP